MNAKAKNYTRGKLRQKLGETQVSLTDPDAKSMATTARMPRIVGYNVQTAVEADHHLIVAHEVTMPGFDRDALSMMAAVANDVMTTNQLTASADKGYYKGEEIVASEDAGISVVAAKPMTSNAGARGQFDKADFAYDRGEDVYVCPAGEKLTYRFTGQQDSKALRSNWSGTCTDCAIKAKCTTSKERHVRRSTHGLRLIAQIPKALRRRFQILLESRLLLCCPIFNQKLYGFTKISHLCFLAVMIHLQTVFEQQLVLIMKQSHADFLLASNVDSPIIENDQALAAMFGLCILASVAFWVAFFCWLF